ncbi:MAG: HAD-IA family hydrolase [Verrucomicrobiae bacterium]|nr:HAD-IA family hydrolase [Verrucomicrobiae bacterium]
MKAITFDAVGTLFGLAEPVGETYSRIARSHDWEIPAELLEKAFRNAWRAAPPLHLFHFGEPSTSPEAVERAWWRSLVENCFREARGANGSAFAPFELPESLFTELFDHFGEPEAWSIYPEVSEVLENLSRHYPLAVISNFDFRFHRVSEGLGLRLYFREVLLSGEFGSAKPAASIFGAAADRLGFEPGQILHIGDDPQADWEGGRAAGFEIFELSRPANNLRDLLRFL